MPIEIKELVIKAVISPAEKQPCEGLSKEEINRLKKEITREVTEKVLKRLRKTNER